MISYNIIYALLIIAYSSLMFLGIRLIKRYVSNNADFRTINFVQFLMLATFLFLEAFHYLYTGMANQMCILLTRNFFVFVLNSYLNCKLLGYKNVYTKRGARNVLYVINNTFVYLTIAIICISYVKVNVLPTENNSFERVAQVLKFMGTDNYYPKAMSFVPLGYCLFSYISCIIMDILEKRTNFTKISTFILIIPFMVLLLDSTPLYSRTHYSIRLFLNSLYFTIPTLSMMYEALSIIYFSKKSKLEEEGDNINKIIYKSFMENRKNISKAGEIQAKIIAKEIEKNNDLLWVLPRGKRNQKYKEYIVSLLEDPE